MQDKSFKCELQTTPQNTKPWVVPKAIGKKIVKPMTCLGNKEKQPVKKVYAGFMKSSDLNPLNTSSCNVTPRETKKSKRRHPSRPKSTINLFGGPQHEAWTPSRSVYHKQQTGNSMSECLNRSFHAVKKDALLSGPIKITQQLTPNNDLKAVQKLTRRCYQKNTSQIVF